MIKTGVIQPLPGIGDMVWYLPALRAIAAAAPDGKITLFTRPSAQADAVMHAEPMIASVAPLPAKRRGIMGAFPNFFHTWLVLRRLRPDRLFILHQSGRYRMAARLAGIREIIAYPPDLARSKEDGWKKSLHFLERCGIHIAEPLSRLAVDPGTVELIKAQFAAYPQPWIVVAPGASTEERRWSTDRFAFCADTLAKATGGTIFLIGGKRETEHITAIMQACAWGNKMVPVIGVGFDHIMGLIANSAFLLGNDSGPANIAAAIGKPAFALCGTSTPPRHSPHLHLIMPDLPPQKAQGMEGITPQHVVDTIRAKLASR